MAVVDAKKWADLFEVDLNSSLEEGGSADYDTTASERVLSSFEQKCSDMKATMKPEAPKPDNDLIAQAMKKAKEEPPPKIVPKSDPDLEAELSDADLGLIAADVEQEVDADIAALDVSKEIEEEEAEKTATETSLVGPEPIQDEAADVPDKLPTEENPLQFDGMWLERYHELKAKYPQFVFYDGSRAFRDFYRHKFWSVWNALHEFAILPVKEWDEEVSAINLRHFVGEDVISPDLVQKKLDQVYQHRVRVAELLIKVYHQYFFWERSLERLQAKLWKDHEVKGAHRRDALILEHLTDIDNYYQKLKGFVESAKHADAMLKAAADSLSRQLTCLQMKEQIAVPHHDPSSPKPRVAVDSMDGISDGEVIKAPKSWGVLAPVDDGVTGSDEIAELG